MKNKILILLSFVLLFFVVFMLIKKDKGSITEIQVKNLGKAVDAAFQQRPNSNGSQNSNQSDNLNQPQNNTETIMAIIYKKPQATWFIKARGNSQLVDKKSAEFSQLFLDQLTFNDNHTPNFDHVPQKYQSGSNQAMRVATFNLDGLEVSVIKLSGTQDIQANIVRWKNQLNLAADAPAFVKYQDNNNTVLVRINQPSNKPQSRPMPPAKEELKTFTRFNFNDKWKIVDNNHGMASGTLALNLDKERFEVAILRLPTNIPLQTIFSIWKDKIGIDKEAVVKPKKLINNFNQEWQVYRLTSKTDDVLIATFVGQNKRTFFRLSGKNNISKEAENQFMTLLKTTEITKS